MQDRVVKDNSIKIKGARLNNLKNINLEIPRDKMVVITGISGSGKSSLAFDTIFAEGQRRFVESLSSFARQFLGRMSKPDVDEITGIPPAIAIEQKVNTRNPRSTVGTSTEIYDYLRLLFTKSGKTYSPVTGEEVKRDTVADVVNYIKTLPQGETIYILSPFGWESSESRTENLLALKEEGFTRLFCKGELVRIESALNGDFNTPDKVYLLVDRVINDNSEEADNRLFDSLSTAFSVKRGADRERETIYIAAGKDFNLRAFSSLFERDGVLFEEPTELLFSYNNPLGACPACSGYGKIVGIDETLVIPDPSLSIYQEAIACWRGETMKNYLNDLIINSHKFDFPIHKPYHSLSVEQKNLIWEGNSYFTGLNEFFKIIDSNKYKIQFRFMLSRYSGKTTCPECKGKRLRREALYIKIGGKTITDLLEMSIENLYTFLSNLKLDSYQQKIGERALIELKNRLSCMISVGLPYLTLNRASNTLSGGESQRINLVSTIGSSLVGSLYILDEPSIGLHPRDTRRLITVLKQLRDLGNSVLIVEHDEEIMRAADQLIDIGPYAGNFGGELVFQGEIDDNLTESECGRSLTLRYLRGFEKIETPLMRRQWSSYIEIKGAYENNLKDIDVKFPLRVLIAVTGVSGSGKSTLVRDILFPAINRRLNQFGERPALHKELCGDVSKVTAVEYIDQNPIGKSTRSNPATYLKVYDEIRRLFSEQPYAKANRYGHSHFSFNIDGGRCPECQGEGVINIEMQFMADVQMVCESCGGKRFKQDILEVRYKEKNINDVLNMSVGEAVEFFSSQKEAASLRVAHKLKPLMDVGLSYVQLGQSSSTLSGGESQRVKLASFLGKESGSESILFIFDEPTTGLHFNDIKSLMDSFNALIARGHTVIVIEHNMDVVKCADWIIDMGPEGGDDGGEVVFAGTPEDIVKCERSYTGKSLAALASFTRDY
ncbi:MAG: excinuclease ABC subunit A [Bacteroidetes bacterium HGW-Bacteroidetes-8]|jgi:excinuclease ABC subunit A|nr:MAG: excinuclease ABC subunit A [Bacteroidetes bacterium HGW-Bacteroidetes-8]